MKLNRRTLLSALLGTPAVAMAGLSKLTETASPPILTDNASVTRDVHDSLALLEPEATPLITLLVKMGKVKPYPQPTVPLKGWSATTHTYTQVFRERAALPIKTIPLPITPRDRTYYQDRAIKRLKANMNYSFLLSQARDQLPAADGHLFRSTMGLASVPGLHLDVNGRLTRAEFETFCRLAFLSGPKTKLLIASPIVFSAIQRWSGSIVHVMPLKRSLGMTLNQVLTGYGQWIMVKDWMLHRDGVDLYTFSVDLDQVEIVVLDSRWLQLYEDAGGDDWSPSYDEVVGEYGLAVHKPKCHAKLTNVRGYE
jgi:hypothetical protein